MHSVTSNAVAKALSYSTEEVKTGAVWTNGKAIYRKTYIKTVSTAGSTTVADISSLNIDMITNLTQITKAYNNNQSAIYYISPDDYSRTFYQYSTKTLVYEKGTYYPQVPLTVYVTIEYTKN